LNIIVTGFEPFLDNDINPTLEVLELLPKSIKGNNIITVKLPVVYDQCFTVLKPYIDKYKPGVIINLGLAPRRKNISLERVALNVNSSTHGDNSGVVKIDESIILNGKNAYFSKLPLREIYNVLNKKGISVEISNTAGLYICNNIMYHVLHYIDINNLNTKAGFIHVPFMDKQVKNKLDNSLPLVTMLEGVIDAIKQTL
jgi:pyroglutamyl-peptidase